MFSTLLHLAALACVPSLATAHMIMKQPVPYGKATLDNSPLVGPDFPCKQRRGVYEVTKMNEMPVGESQTLSFEGSAVHEGGSCQLSVSLDKEPTADSTFKVIHSIIGGCPGITGPDTFNFTMPDSIPNGEYTLAWTWFNKVGNRELYMNCAPIHVTGGADNHDLYDALPDMFVANIPSAHCETPEMKNPVFPNPGDSIETVVSASLATSFSGAGCQKATKSVASTSTPATSSDSPKCTEATSSTEAPASSSSGVPVPPMVTVITVTSTKIVTPKGPATPAAATSSSAPATPDAETSSLALTVSVTVTRSLKTAESHTVTRTLESTKTHTVTRTLKSATPHTATSSLATASPSGTETFAPGDSGCDADGELICNGESLYGFCCGGTVSWKPVSPNTRCHEGKILRLRRFEA